MKNKNELVWTYNIDDFIFIFWKKGKSSINKIWIYFELCLIIPINEQNLKLWLLKTLLRFVNIN